MSTTYPAIACLLTDPPRVLLDLWCSASSFSDGQTAFQPIDTAESTGFYDWLRQSDGKLVGLRYWPFEGTRFLLDYCREKEIGRINPRGAIELLFAPGQVDELRSANQAFQYIVPFRSAAEQYALLIDAGELSEADLELLHQLNRSGGERP